MPPPVRIDAAPPAPLPVDAAPATRPDAGSAAPTPPDAAPATPAPLDAAPATPAPADATPTDPADNPAIEEIPRQVAVQLQRSQGRLSRCYTLATKALPEDQALSGEVDIAFEVMPTGETRNVSVARNTTGSNQLGACIADVVASWAFAPYEGEPVNLLRTFRFRASS